MKKRGLWLALVPLFANAQVVGGSALIAATPDNVAMFGAIGRLRAQYSCTAFLVRPDGVADSAPAHAVTAGHCIERAPNRIVIGRDVTSGTVTFRYFAGAPQQWLPVAVRRVAYATMKGHDLAILELDASLGRLVEQGLRPLEMAGEAASDGEPVEFIGAPAGSIPADEAFLRRGRCRLGPQVDLIEFNWHFRGAYRNDCPDVRESASGSPVIGANGKVLAVMTTTTLGAEPLPGEPLCFAGQPCEVAIGGKQYRRDASYAIPAHGLSRCFHAATGGFDNRRAGCPLDPGIQLEPSTPFYTAGAGTRWNVTLSGALTHYRYKVARETRDDCSNAAGYGLVRALAEASRIEDEIPAEEGRYYLCVLAGPAAQPGAEGWQQPAFASKVHVRIDRTPPPIPIPYTFLEQEGAYLVEPIFVLPELIDYSYKLVAQDGDSCSNTAGYQPYRRFPIRVAKPGDGADALSRMCITGRDYAGNPATPIEIKLRGPNFLPGSVLNAAGQRGLDPGLSSPGAWLTIFGVNFPAAARLRLIDGSGAAYDLTPAYSDTRQINVRVPERAALGAARLELATSAGPVTDAITLVPAAPGIFTASQNGGGVPVGFEERVSSGRRWLFDCPPRSVCTPAVLDPFDRGGPIRITIFATGAPAPVNASLGGLSLDVKDAAEELPGVQRLTLAIPEGRPIEGFLPLTISSGGPSSNTVWIRLRAVALSTAAARTSGVE